MTFNYRERVYGVFKLLKLFVHLVLTADTETILKVGVKEVKEIKEIKKTKVKKTKVYFPDLNRGSGKRGERDQVHYDGYDREPGDIMSKARVQQYYSDEYMYKKAKRSDRRMRKVLSGYDEDDGFVVSG